MEGINKDYTFIKESIVCPYCQTSMIPDLLYGSISTKSGMNIFCRCTNHNCEKTFICMYGAKERLPNGNRKNKNSSRKHIPDMGLQM